MMDVPSEFMRESSRSKLSIDRASTRKMPRRLAKASAFICLLGTIFFLLTRNSSQGPASGFGSSTQAESQEPFSLAAFYERVPYTSSWQSWLHPHRLGSGKGSSIIDRKWNILYHLGGNGPWVEKIDGIAEGGIGVPEGCTVEQVHMMARHAERYPTIKVGTRMLDLLKRIKKSSITLHGDLEFANSWTYFTDDPEKYLEQLTSTGPFAGTLEAFTTGVKLRTRYSHLIDESRLMNLWASDSNRVIETAKYFSLGFFGLDWLSKAKLHVIPETDDLGADTLTPSDTCKKYNLDLVTGHDYGAHMMESFRSTYLKPIADRLEKQNPAMRFNDSEIYSMQETCGFETTVRGSSRWCDVFTHKEWQGFEYARDVIHFYRTGPGNPYGPAMGWLWLNTTANLLSTGPSAGPFFFSFVHDSDIIAMFGALNILPEANDLPITHILSSRSWKTSQVTPMGGRVIFERLSCSSGTSQKKASARKEKVYVRVNINDGIVPMPGCHSGPGQSCPLDEFLRYVEDRGKTVGDFREKCGLGPDSADHITFLHQ